KSFVGLQAINPGFDTSNLLTMRIVLSGPMYDSNYKRMAFWDRVLPELNSRPGITSASIVNTLPLSGGNNNNFFSVEGITNQKGQDPVMEIRWVSARYLGTMKIPMKRGRVFTDAEAADSSVAGRVAVINEYTARKFWPKGDAIGKRFCFCDPSSSTSTNPRWNTVIGIAADIKHKR